MSIYCTRVSMDGDPDGLPQPIAYLGSHVRLSEDARRYGYLDTAHIPEWCGVDAGLDDESTWRPVPYFRLAVTGYDEDAPGEESHATVVLDEALVRALRDDLTNWLEHTEGRA